VYELVPLLRLQRDLLEIPRGMERFRRYLWLLTEGRDDVVRPPLGGFNPMSREHVARVLDALLALDAETVAAGALAEAEARLAGLEAEDERVGMVVLDDVAGGWTDRRLIEAHGMVKAITARQRRGWLAVGVWASDPVDAATVRRSTLSAVYRVFAFNRFGVPRTLRQVIEREALVARFTGDDAPTLEPDDLAYTREVLEPYLDSDDFPVLFACLFGDEDARRRGYTALGLSPFAGLAVARDEARRLASPPESALLT
jgi:hypothetical protein